MLGLVEDLMALTLNRVRQLKAEQMFDNADAQILRAALDHLALDMKHGVSDGRDLAHSSSFHTMY